MKSHSIQTLSRGFALITSLLFLIIIGLIGVMMMKNYGLQGKMTGNFREKGRSFESAQSALQYAEWWLKQGNATTGTSCSSVVSSAVVCSNALSNPTSLPWSAGVNYTPSGMNIASSGVSSFAQSPQFYIQYIGTNTTTSQAVYLITAVGYGGNSQAVTVLQSSYGIGGAQGGNNLGK